jgi:3'-phosphoadenosine 5'-phosphosulfate sulfotransferase (PAPS reductase)/FAD synthetase
MREIHVHKQVKLALESGAPLVISVSGGKDSDAMAIALSELRTRNKWTGRMILIHADLGRMEWQQSKTRCEKLAERLNAEFVVVEHSKGDLLTGIDARRESRPDSPAFPSPASKYCTAGWKRAVISKWIRNEFVSDQTVICAMGLRSDESTARAKRKPVTTRVDATAKTKNRLTLDWNPILRWSVDDVWEAIGTNWVDVKITQNAVKAYAKGKTIPEVFAYIESLNFPAHPAYALGNERVSCALCMMASRNDLVNGVRYNPEIAQEISKRELEWGYTYTHNESITEIIKELHTPKN